MDNVFMLGLGEGEGIKPNTNIVRIVMHIAELLDGPLPVMHLRPIGLR
jgi:hypothetical protein